MLENQAPGDLGGGDRDVLAAPYRRCNSGEGSCDEREMTVLQVVVLPYVAPGRCRARAIIPRSSRIRAPRRDVALRVRFRCLSAIALAIAALLVLAGCGGSGPDQTAAAVKRCQQRGASHGACQCAVTYASAHGDPPAKLIREMSDGSAARDPVAVQAGALCVGAK